MFSPKMPTEVNNFLQTVVAASPVNQSRAENLFFTSANAVMDLAAGVTE
ncbi:MAG: hypothetical protein PHD43_14570 [Methylococcales bacterium]|nr:hypothetical protein [Methylococcales bacterium]